MRADAAKPCLAPSSPRSSDDPSQHPGTRYEPRAVAGSAVAVADFVRGTPLLVQLYFLFYVLPDVGITLSPLAAGIISLGLHYSTYTAEVYRAGIEAIPHGQWEAARALGLASRPTWVRVILPQAIPPMIPALGNYAISMFKETPLLSAITVAEIMGKARSLANANYRYLEPITVVGLLFLVLSLLSAFGLRSLEHRYGRLR